MGEAKNKGKLELVGGEKEIKEKVQDILIHFSDYDMQSGEELLRTLEVKEIAGHQVGQHWVAIISQGGNMTEVYPAKNVSYVRVIVRDKE